jgi:hypothetical protein
MQTFHYGIVEDRDDPLRLGRCRVRVIGLHTSDKAKLPVQDLPWAWPIQDISSAALSGIGRSATGLVEGSTVIVYFADESNQIPMIIGSLAGIPSGANELVGIDNATPLQQESAITPPATAPANQVKLQTGAVIDATAVKSTDKVMSIVESSYIGSLTNSQVTKLKTEIAKHESGAKGYSAENSLGFLGKYQFGALYLEDTGYIKKGAYRAIKNNLAVVSDDANWTSKNSIANKESFKSKGPIQEELMDLMLKRNYTTLCKCDAVSIDTPPEKLAGALMVAHLKGAGGARDYIKKGVNSSDAYGTSCEKYYLIGYAAISGKVVASAPTSDNINRKDNTSAITSQKGFTDPNGKYPLVNHLNEPDTPRVASVQKISQTIVGEKDSDRVTNIPVANSSVVWDQSPIPYNAKYPYNHAYVSESGHVLEFDDSTGRERINLHHTAGTFIEIDSYGNRVDKIKGIRTVIVDENELVYIQGSGHVSIDGDMSVRVGGQCQIEVVGNANIKVKGNLTGHVVGNTSLKVDGDMHQDVLGEYKIIAGGGFSITSHKDINFNAMSGKYNVDATAMNLNAGVSTMVDQLPNDVAYTPSIAIPSPVTRDEEMGFNMEDDSSLDAKSVAAALASGAPPMNTVSSDTSPVTARSGTLLVCSFGTLNNDTVLLDSSVKGASGVIKTWTIKDLCVDGSFVFSGQRGLTGAQIACNMKQLVSNVIEPLRADADLSGKGFKINSCFRPMKNGKSQHEIGCAVDIGFSKIRGANDDRKQYYEIAKRIKGMIPFDQLILEYRSSGSVWIHISYVGTGNRGQVLTLNDDKVIGVGLIELSQA